MIKSKDQGLATVAASSHDATAAVSQGRGDLDGAASLRKAGIRLEDVAAGVGNSFGFCVGKHRLIGSLERCSKGRDGAAVAAKGSSIGTIERSIS